jgi:hypothetical protein
VSAGVLQPESGSLLKCGLDVQSIRWIIVPIDRSFVCEQGFHLSSDPSPPLGGRWAHRVIETRFSTTK